MSGSSPLVPGLHRTRCYMVCKCKFMMSKNRSKYDPINDGRYAVRCFECRNDVPYSYNGRPSRSTVNRQLSNVATVLTYHATRPALPHERRSSVSGYARLRPDGRNMVHCTPVASSFHATALGAERIHVLLITPATGAAIS